MGLKEIVAVILNKDDGFRPCCLAKLEQESKENLKLARLFLKINTDSPYSFSGPPKSRLYCKNEIDQILIANGYSQTADQLIQQGFISFYWASRGIAGVQIVPYSNTAGETRYRFEAEFCEDGG